jgi:phosphoribosyl 1,2-cyclic phosphate phosphodiesterase
VRVTVLGSGTSMGVPSLGCHCRVCSSRDPHDNRTRPSVVVSRDDHNVVIDTTPDFRFQALRYGLESLDAIVFTHGHADHILGFDDIRPYNLRQKAAVPIYASKETLAILRRTFAYVFDGKPVLSTIPEVTPHVIEGPFELLGIAWKPIPAEHGDMPVLGFRVGGFAYLTDFSRIPEESMPCSRARTNWCWTRSAMSHTRCTRPWNRLWSWSPEFGRAGHGSRISPTICPIRKRTSAWCAWVFPMCNWPTTA